MSYYRYITGVYKSYWPGLNRTLRSTSAPRTVPDIDCGTFGLTVSGLENGILLGGENYQDRRVRSMSEPRDFYSSAAFMTRHTATPFRDRAMTPPPAYTPRTFTSSALSNNRLCSQCSSQSKVDSHYTDFDFKVMDYQGQLDRQESARATVSRTRNNRSPSGRGEGQFTSNYDFYDASKHSEDYLYKSSRDVLGSWKIAGLSRDTLRQRNDRAASPLVSRGLDRYFGGQRRVDYLGDVSSGRSDFRHYNYRTIPYLGGSDYLKHIPKHLDYLNDIPGQRFRH